ncbi:hypothetical protein [Streptomyces sp. NPDC001500]
MSILRPEVERPRDRAADDRAREIRAGADRAREDRVRDRRRGEDRGAPLAPGGGRSTPPDGVLSRAARFAGRTLRREWYGIVVDPLRQLRRRGPGALLLAVVACLGVIFFHALAQHPAGATAVRAVGGVRGDLPLWLALLRTPVSLYVPALDLPVWAGITQLFLAFALAELSLGRGRTLLVAYASTLAGTLSVRVMLAAGPGWWGFGLPPEVGQVLDTGPSAAVVGLFTFLSVVRRAPIVFTLTGGSMVLESIAKPNLAGREHLIAVAAAVVMGLLHERARRGGRMPSLSLDPSTG